MISHDPDKVYDLLADNCDDGYIEQIFSNFFGSTEQATRTLRILDAFYLPVEVEPGDETPRKKLKGISVLEVGDTLLNIGFALGYLNAKN
ncbi:MAG: hypothetical protein IJG24_03615 [Selenomonadaceae bacterium]|nr:hypothetical protein [Selenomonadaceae bacterium]